MGISLWREISIPFCNFSFRGSFMLKATRWCSWRRTGRGCLLLSICKGKFWNSVEPPYLPILSTDCCLIINGIGWGGGNPNCLKRGRKNECKGIKTISLNNAVLHHSACLFLAWHTCCTVTSSMHGRINKSSPLATCGVQQYRMIELTWKKH